MSSSEALNLLNAHACGADRRQHPRIYVNWRTAVMFKTGHETVRVFGRTRDASASGVCIECEQTIITAAPVVVMIELPSKAAHVPSDIIQFNAQIRNCILASDKYRMGLQIIGFHGHSEQNMLRHLRTIGA
ncbi:PilZ domain-containing protein [Sulfuriferula thiophila]|uniref:PilZ domain-containing protein n=1 Tax=Sulfuriferula thiophila TaxID=1781211 RepID=UPI000F604EDB|nr:PilZ domain-containing protein [Sulfuriferula thiophila]